MHRPYGDIGVTFGAQLPGARIVRARLDVVATDLNPPVANVSDLSSFAAAESARPDSFDKLMSGADKPFARADLNPYLPGSFVLKAAVLNALPTNVPSYTVYLLESVDESACFGTPESSTAPGLSAYSVVAQLVP